MLHHAINQFCIKQNRLIAASHYALLAAKTFALFPGAR